MSNYIRSATCQLFWYKYLILSRCHSLSFLLYRNNYHTCHRLVLPATMVSRFLLILSLFSASILAASCPRTQINFKSDFEPSDIVWDASREVL